MNLSEILQNAFEIFGGMNPYDDDGTQRRRAAEQAVNAADVSRQNRSFAVAQVLKAWDRYDAAQAEQHRQFLAARETAMAEVAVPAAIISTPGEAAFRSAVVDGNSGECAAHAAIVRHIQEAVAATPFSGVKTVTRQGEYVTHEESFGGLAGGDYSEWQEDTPEWAAAKAATKSALMTELGAALDHCRTAVEAAETVRRAEQHAAANAAWEKKMAEAEKKRAAWKAEIASVFPASEGFSVVGDKVTLNGEYFDLISDWMAGKLAEYKAKKLANRAEIAAALAKSDATKKRGEALRAKLGLSHKWEPGEHRGAVQLSVYIATSRKDGYRLVCDERGRFGKVGRKFEPISREEAVKLVG